MPRRKKTRSGAGWGQSCGARVAGAYAGGRFYQPVPSWYRLVAGAYAGGHCNLTSTSGGSHSPKLSGLLTKTGGQGCSRSGSCPAAQPTSRRSSAHICALSPLGGVTRRADSLSFQFILRISRTRCWGLFSRRWKPWAGSPCGYFGGDFLPPCYAFDSIMCLRAGALLGVAAVGAMVTVRRRSRRLGPSHSQELQIQQQRAGRRGNSPGNASPLTSENERQNLLKPAWINAAIVISLLRLGRLKVG